MLKGQPINFVAEGSRLTFIKQTRKGSGNYNSGTQVLRAKGLYLCSCGKEVELIIAAVKNGSTKSCGCLHRENTSKSNKKHGLGRSPLYPVYKSIIQRCTNPNNPAYPLYGGAGVIMCELWRNSFKEFHDWCLSNGWERGMQVDKDAIPKKIGIPALLYSPETCSILTSKENANHKRNNRPITFNGETKNLCQWADELKISHCVIQNRLRKGWPMKDVLSPLKNIHTSNRVDDEIREKAKQLHMIGCSNIKIGIELGIDRSTVSRIINKKGYYSCHYL